MTYPEEEGKSLPVVADHEVFRFNSKLTDDLLKELRLPPLEEMDQVFTYTYVPDLHCKVKDGKIKSTLTAQTLFTRYKGHLAYTFVQQS